LCFYRGGYREEFLACIHSLLGEIFLKKRVNYADYLQMADAVQS